MLNVLITGVGGPVGQAIIKAARASTLRCRLVGTDRNELSAGFQWADAWSVLPSACREEPYLDGITLLCRREGIHAILPASDSELELLARYAGQIRAETGAAVIASRPEALHTALDKWNTSEFLRTSGLGYPRTALLCEPEQVELLLRSVGFPLIAKPRRGSGSRGVARLGCRDDLDALSTLHGEMIVQEYLQPDEEEYTVAVFTLRDSRQAGCILLRREIAAGLTYRAWVAHREEVAREACAVAKALGPSGPCNVQMRLTERGAITFEVNPRFSSSTAIRAHFGFNEVDMALRHYVLGEDVAEPVIRDGTALRYWEELYLPPAGQGAETGS